MATLDALKKKIDELKNRINQLNDSKSEEKVQLQEQILIIEECEKIIDNESLMASYDFTNTMQLIESYNYSIENLSQIISDIQNVLSIREELKISSEDMPLEESQVETFQLFIDKLKKLKEELNERLTKITENKESEEKISNLEELEDILAGRGRRKYYTQDMIQSFAEEFDILSLPPEEALTILEGFYQTRNFNNPQSTEKTNIEEVIALYREYVPSTSMKIFETLINNHKNEISSSIDIDNTREILQFLKDKGIIDKFRRTTLLKISLYGKADYIKDTVYNEVMSNTPEVIEIFYEDDLASIWIKEKGTRVHKQSPFRKNRGHGEEKDTDSLYRSCHTIDYDEFWENIRILRNNRSLFDDKFDIDDTGANLNIKTLQVWLLKKNIELCKLYGLGTITPLPTSCIDRGDIEDKIHLAIELGLLNPPLNLKFRDIDKDIIKNDEFQRNYIRKKIYNQSIRNYFQRYLSKLSNISINEYAYLFYLLQNEGYIDFYNDFFSEIYAGKGNPGIISSKEKEMISDKHKMNDFITENFMIEWYSDHIENYDEYNDIINEYTEEEKKTKFEDQGYIDSSILEEPLIKELEEKNTIMDIVTQNDETVERKNEFVYMFGDRIISRYKVLRNASILKDMYGYLTKEMLITSIVRNSFLDNDTFQDIYISIMERGKTI